MELEDVLLYEGRRYRVAGFDPVSVTPQRVYLCDLESGEVVAPLYEELLAAVRDVRREQDREDGPRG